MKFYLYVIIEFYLYVIIEFYLYVIIEFYTCIWYNHLQTQGCMGVSGVLIDKFITKIYRECVIKQ